MTSIFHILEFVHVEPSLHAKGESLLVTTHDPFNVLLNPVCLNFLGTFCI